MLCVTFAKQVRRDRLERQLWTRVRLASQEGLPPREARFVYTVPPVNTSIRVVVLCVIPALLALPLKVLEQFIALSVPSAPLGFTRILDSLCARVVQQEGISLG